MRARLIVVTSLFVLGCGEAPVPQPSLVVGALSLNGGTPSPDGQAVCFGFCPGGYPDQPLSNPWAPGQRGYIIYGNVANFDGTGPGYGLIGLDATMTTVLWKRETVGDANLNWYLNLPGTIPFTCSKTPDAGQVGSSNTKTGGGNIWCDQVCFSNTYITEIQTNCHCVSEPAANACNAAGDSCGPSVDNCKLPINCGLCGLGRRCTAGQCICTRVCGKGMWLDENCVCNSGIPY